MASQNGQIVRPLSDTPNWEVANAIRNEASPMFQARTPSFTQANYRASLEQMYNYPDLRNEWTQALVNRICGTYVHKLDWEQPLAEFKRAQKSFGKTYEEVAVGLIKAIVYDPNQEYLGDEIFGNHKVDVRSYFHTVNREEVYPITINESQMRYAFTTDDGLGQLVSQMMDAPRISDNLDEYLAMANMFKEYAHLGGYYRVSTPDLRAANSDSDEAKLFLKKMRAMIGNVCMKPSTRYNAAHMPAVAKKDDLIIFTSPEVHASMDVDGLAPLFHLDKAEMQNRIIEISQEDFGIGGKKGTTQAIVTTREFFFCWDYLYGTYTSMINPISLAQNYFLQHKEAISVSPFVPALLFWTGDETPVNLVDPQGVSTTKPDFQISLRKYGDPSVKPDHVDRGSNVQVVSTITVKNNPTWKPTGVLYSLKSKPSSQFTHITQSGILVCGIDETSDSLDVVSTATYINPDTPEADSVASETLTVPVEGEGVLGVVPGVVSKITIVNPTETVPVGTDVQLYAYGTLANGNNPDLTNVVKWSVKDTDSAIAKINEVGTLTPLAVGTAHVESTVFGITGELDVVISSATSESETKDSGNEEKPESFEVPTV